MTWFESTLQDCFDCTAEDVFCDLCDRLDELTDFSFYISLCVDSVILVKPFTNNKPWVTRSLKNTDIYIYTYKNINKKNLYHR